MWPIKKAEDDEQSRQTIYTKGVFSWDISVIVAVSGMAHLNDRATISGDIMVISLRTATWQT